MYWYASTLDVVIFGPVKAGMYKQRDDYLHAHDKFTALPQHVEAFFTMYSMPPNTTVWLQPCNVFTTICLVQQSKWFVLH